ncbi:MAG: sigma-54 dependent transcriptional regulator [Acidobacteria bacterium]|nr:sigma-54 dependent transcriptional regulator [Acidobacteriota bacterium]
MLQVFKELAKSLGNNHTSVKTSTTGKRFLVTGETGTGKELVARLIHRHSSYRTGSFIAVNCSTLPAELADSELFGSSPGAFTGADRHEHHGLWEMANGGTLFLDEITEASRAVMPKLLRVLQDGQVRRLGAKRWVKTDVQVVAATNRNLVEEVKRGRFREDLYHRLSHHQIHMPPLRERLEDVPLLAVHFAHLQTGGTVQFAQDALQLLTDFSSEYQWRGNVRELENVVRRAIAHAPDKTVYAVDLAPHLPMKDETNRSQSHKREGANDGDERADCVCSNNNRGGLDEQVKCFRNRVVKETLAAQGNNRSLAAKTLQISRSTMHRIIDGLE